MEMKITFNYFGGGSGAYITVDTEKCGITFYDVAIIHEPHSENPLIAIHRPLGVNAVKRIIQMLEEYHGDQIKS